MHDTEDKSWWVVHGANKEILFVEKVCPKLNLGAVINPAKKGNPFLPDLIVDGKLADLKCQETPFFKAKEIYNIDPQFAFTFNQKDYQRYSARYPDLIIYIWVNWKVLSRHIGGKVYTVSPLTGVWRVPFPRLRSMIDQRHLHKYQRRQDDQRGNAKGSFIFDVRDFECLYQN